MNNKDNNNRKYFLIPTFLAEENDETILAPIIKEALTELNYFLVEEVRTARRFISKMRTGRVIEELIFFEVNKKTSIAEVEKIIAKIPKDESIGIMSEAGCPGIADPGAAVAMVAHRRGGHIVPLPGPSSIFMSLMASGFSGQKFCFSGYLPIARAERVKAILALEREAEKGVTQLFMETPYRNNPLLEDLLKTLKGATNLCIAAEVTGSNEFIKTKSVKEWRGNEIPNLHKRPTIFLIEAVKTK